MAVHIGDVVWASKHAYTRVQKRAKRLGFASASKNLVKRRDLVAVVAVVRGRVEYARKTAEGAVASAVQEIENTVVKIEPCGRWGPHVEFTPRLSLFHTGVRAFPGEDRERA
jgi:hypothetical protein